MSPGSAKTTSSIGEEFIDPDDGKTNATGDPLSICHRERQILLLDRDVDFLKRLFRDPSVFASHVD